jgi:hypothetical protein
MGFPGICCIHCRRRNTLGRYFPVSVKNLTDSTSNSLLAHVTSCPRCPEVIKASLAYLGHRSILQKAELSGSWKKAFFQKIWSRLHVERTWTEPNDDDGADASSVDEQKLSVEAEDASHDRGEAGSEGEKEDLGDHMNALIKAAAIWLTEQDAATESTKGPTRASRGRALPSKRAAALPTTKGARAATTLPTAKRRRVHF